MSIYVIFFTKYDDTLLKLTVLPYVRAAALFFKKEILNNFFLSLQKFYL